MTVTPAQKQLIQHIVNVWETGTPLGDYGQVCIYHDGKDNSPQITYGRSQTTEQGNLQDLIALYISMNGTYADAFKTEWVQRIGKVPLYRDDLFISYLKQAAADPIMHAAQDKFFDQDYWNPAMSWAEANGFTLPLAALVIYDSYIQSGEIFMFLRDRFSEPIPTNGGDEQVWLKEYVYVRGEWLRNYSSGDAERDKALNASVYRTGDMMRQIVAKNWDLSQVPIMANGMGVSA